MQSLPPSHVPVASDLEFQVSISAVSDGPSFASGSAHATQPFANLHSEPSTSPPLECPVVEFELGPQEMNDDICVCIELIINT